MNEEFNSSLIIYQMASYSISATFRVLCNWINLQLFFPPCAASATCEEGKWLVNGNTAFGKVSVVSQTWVLFCLLAKSSMEFFFFLFYPHESNLKKTKPRTSTDQLV